MSRSRVAVTLLSLTLASCVTMRVYQLPLSPSEGQAMVPALISACQSQGLEAFRGPNGAVANLEDGVMLSWQDSANHDDFILLMSLPDKVPEAEAQARFDKAKARADQLWNIAVASRQVMMPLPAVVVMPQPLPAQSTTVTAPGTTISIGGALMPNVTVTVQDAPAPQPSSSSSASCCINGAGYSCSSAAAVDRCSGAFLRCMSACNFSCQGKCEREAPLDPSGCQRDPSLDASCQR